MGKVGARELWRRRAGRIVAIEGEPMPSRETVEAFVAQVLKGEYVEAIRDWYAEDASMQENQEPPRVGREVLMAGEAAMLARSRRRARAAARRRRVTATRWRSTGASPSPSRAAGSVRRFEEIAWQTWRGDKIWRERFFYDPAQTR
jgi:hypothetical protein